MLIYRAAPSKVQASPNPKWTTLFRFRSSWALAVTTITLPSTTIRRFRRSNRWSKTKQDSRTSSLNTGWNVWAMKI